MTWQCSKTAVISWDWCSLIRALDKGKAPGGLATVIFSEQHHQAQSQGSHCHYWNKGNPSWKDMRAWTYHQFCADLRPKRAKATFCLKFDLLLISSSFGILWPKELEGLDWLFKFVARVEVTVDLKNKYRTISWLHQGLVYYVLQREDVALNSMNQLTNWVLEFHSQLFYSFNCCFRTEKNT